MELPLDNELLLRGRAAAVGLSVARIAPGCRPLCSNTGEHALRIQRSNGPYPCHFDKRVGSKLSQGNVLRGELKPGGRSRLLSGAGTVQNVR